LGQRMRADLAASMLHNPDILYLDEPTIGLDVMVKERIRKAIKSMNKKYNVTVILTTHDMSDIQELATRIMIIDKGEIIYDGSKEAINNQFGNTRQLSLKLDNLSEKHITLIDDFMKPYDRDVKIDEQSLIITFNQDQIAVADILSFVMNECKVLDFSLQDQNIEDIVKKLYRGDVS